MTVDAATTEALFEIDRQVDQAATSADRGALETLLAENFIYQHSTGKVETREEWIEGLMPLAGQRDRVPEPRTVEMHGDLAVVMGDLDINWFTGRSNAYNRYVRIYQRREGGWSAISQRTVPAPDRYPE